MSVLSERIRQVRERAGATMEVFGEKIGVSKQAVYQYEKGKREPSRELLDAMADAFGVNRVWLHTGEGPMLLAGQGDGAKHEPQQITPTETQKGYPYMIGGVGAGSSGRVQHWEGERVYVPQDVVANWTGGQVPAYNEAYWTRVRGTSMEPWLPEETPIFVVRCEAIGADGRYVLYLDDDDAEIVKRVEKLGDGTYLLKPDNPAHGARKLRRIVDGDDDMYDDLTHDMRVRMRVRGRVVYPTDSPQAILRTFAQQMAEVLRQR